MDQDINSDFRDGAWDDRDLQVDDRDPATDETYTSPRHWAED